MSTLVGAMATDVGRIRSVNQDGALTSAYLFAVADGMGGHNGGEVASNLALEALRATPAAAAAVQARPFRTIEELIQAVEEANESVFASARANAAVFNMGTTLCALALIQPVGAVERIGLVNVGDSRIYRWHGDHLLQLTQDHSLVQDMVRDGHLTADEALRHPQRNILTRALGIEAMTMSDSWEREPVVGERYLLCSDGLFNELTAEQISVALGAFRDPGEAALKLVRQAVDAGGRDNVTCVVVDVHAEDANWERPEPVVLAVPTPQARLDRQDPESSVRHRGATALGTETAPPGRLTVRVVLFAGALLVVVAVVVGAVTLFARGSYFLSVKDQEVVVLRGRPGGMLWLDPTLSERTGIMADQLSPSLCDRLNRATSFSDLASARTAVATLREDVLLLRPVVAASTTGVETTSPAALCEIR